MKNMSYTIKTGFCLMLLSATFGAAIADAGNTSNMRSKNMKKTYIRADAGYSFIGRKLSSDYAKKPKGAFIGSVGAGYIIDPKFKADITASYRGEYKYSDSYTRDAVNHNQKQKISSVSLMLNGYLTPKGFMDGSYPKNFERFDPYLMVGVGLAVNKAGDINDTGSDSSSRQAYGNQKRSFAWQVGVGSTFEVANDVALDLMYRYMDSGDVKATPAKGGNLVGNFDTTKGKLRTHEITLGINFKF